MVKNLKKRGNNERRDSNSSDGERELATMKESQQRNHDGNKKARGDAIDSSVPFESNSASRDKREKCNISDRGQSAVGRGKEEEHPKERND